MAKQSVFSIALFCIGIGFGIVLCSVIVGGFDRDTGYLTGIGIILNGAVVLVVAPLYRVGAENGRRGAENGRRITRLERALTDHHAHDRAALQEAVRYACDTATGPQKITHLRH